ncbi:MAG: acetyl-CoA C-acetyltransferase [Gammaproteobacteria bacterium]|jgi:acetyl-CoA C-acetyltransferase|nr:acetyl-CoA C-acetyltransferase [Gammaproteobacteria bacterium]
MSEAYIYDHLRTPRGKGRPDGGLHSVSPVNMLAQVLAHLRDRNDLDSSLVEDVIAGCGSPIGEQGSAIGRSACLAADYASTVPGQQIHRYCSSGLEAVNLAAAKVMSGQCELVIACGVESMSRIPIGSSGGAWSSDPELAYKIHFVPQGISADLIATLHGHSREDVDSYAAVSQRRAAAAWENGYFDRSVITVVDEIGLPLLERDEAIRPGTTVESLARLPAVFARLGEMGFNQQAILKFPQIEKIEHIHTAGNSSGIVDGAGGALIGSAAMGEILGMKPRARIRSCASVGTDPTLMLTGPTPSAQIALRKAGMDRSDIDLFELNEAFASVVLLFMEEMNVPHEQINVNGGAIAMGHPIGATGVMILGTVLDELERRDQGTALVNLCVGAGMGTATIIERI